MLGEAEAGLCFWARGERQNEKEETWLDSITDSMNMNLSKFWETVTDRENCMLQFMGAQRVTYNLATEQ